MWVKTESKENKRRPRALHKIWSVINSLDVICHNICYGKLQFMYNPFGWQNADVNTLLNSMLNVKSPSARTTMNRPCVVCVIYILKALNIFEWCAAFSVLQCLSFPKTDRFCSLRESAAPWEGMTQNLNIKLGVVP